MSVSEITKNRTVTRKITYERNAHIYKTKNGTWRGFVTPYDITFEASTKKKVEEVLPEMVQLYEEGLKRYNNPQHLIAVPLSYEEDIKEFEKLKKL